DLEQQIARWFHAGVSSGGDPAEVAGAIVAAANDTSTPVHVLVGAGAVAAIQAASSMTEEQWAVVSRKAYGIS
ncbi:MAG TPA: hypothetical protein VGK51_17440, partial [Actinomycetota bacterium]